MYKFYLGGGNNSDLVRKVLLKRDWWKETNEGNSMLVNFKWQQGIRGYK